MFQHWTVNLDAERITWLHFDRKNSSVNTLNRDVLEELSTILTTLAQEKNTRGLIIASAKKSGFIAGADIEQFTQFTSVEEATKLVRRGQDILNQIATLPVPSVAMIQGFCLGGGLELALACTYRIAADDVKTRLGLPEVLLGIHPGWGGTIRLPKLTGAPNAMDLILSGRTVSAKAAQQMGFVDEAVPERQLANAARQYILTKPTPHHLGVLQNLTNQAWLRPFLARIFRKKVAAKARQEHYPAPYKVIDLWEKNGVDSAHGYQDEATSLGKLFLSDTARNLVRVFFLQEQLKALGKNTDFVVNHVHVIGAGTMGGDIAAWCAFKGYTVTLQDREAKYISPAIRRAAEFYKKKLKAPHLVQATLDRLIPDVDGHGVAKADVIIEAIYENLEAKQNLFKSLEQQCKKTAILATNTSSIPLDEINTALAHPERLVGIHFFNPVSMMQLVEVVHGAKTSPQVQQNATAFVHQISRLPLPVKSHPGFLVNRVLMPYLMECVVLLDENYAPEAIDEAAVAFGMPMGPLELADTVGLDICLSVAKNLVAHFGGDIPKNLMLKVEKGELGKKTGKGFYAYKNNKKISTPTSFDNVDLSFLADRLILRLLNEAVACYREQIVTKQDYIDAGLIFGAGFAPFRGGPLHYALTEGVENIKKKLTHFEKEYGKRYTPDPGWNLLKPDATIASTDNKRTIGSTT